jgi:hypothetical protein
MSVDKPNPASLNALGSIERALAAWDRLHDLTVRGVRGGEFAAAIRERDCTLQIASDRCRRLRRGKGCGWPLADCPEEMPELCSDKPVPCRVLIVAARAALLAGHHELAAAALGLAYEPLVPWRQASYRDHLEQARAGSSNT